MTPIVMYKNVGLPTLDRPHLAWHLHGAYPAWPGQTARPQKESLIGPLRAFSDVTVETRASAPRSLPRAARR
eukprot:5089999-Pleurochrysis_carterae.AAC.5